MDSSAGLVAHMLPARPRFDSVRSAHGAEPLERAERATQPPARALYPAPPALPEAEVVRALARRLDPVVAGERLAEAGS